MNLVKSRGRTLIRFELSPVHHIIMPDLVRGSIQGRVWGMVPQRRKKNMPTGRGEMAWEDIVEKLKIVARS